MDGIQRVKNRSLASQGDSFAAMQLLNDPQTFAERLLSRCQQGHVRFETRLVMLQVCLDMLHLPNPIHAMRYALPQSM